MENVIQLNLPLKKEDIKKLKVGDMVSLTGPMLVFRDAGHKRLFETIKNNNQAFDYVGETIYFMGPCPAKDNEVIGSAGPTTSCRMDKYTPFMLDNGLVAQIGKGKRDTKSIEAFKRNCCVYFAAIGGAGAIYQKSIKTSTVLCFEDLGTEAIRRIEVDNFPVVVAIDTMGNNIYD